MSNNNIESVPYLVHEGILVRQERTIKRLWILCIIIFLAFVGSNAAWIYYESQWEVIKETTSQEVSQDVDAEDGDLKITGIGNIYGTSEANSQNNDHDEK